jgi:hypothetical protein
MSRQHMHLPSWVLLWVILSMFSLPVWALDQKNICTWDPVGQSGPVISIIDDVLPVTIEWGLELHFIPYFDEKQAVQDFRAGACDMVIATAITARRLITFGGSLDAIGAVTSMDELQSVMAAIAADETAADLVEGDYEMVVSIPVGAMYAFVNDRRISSVDAFRGRTIAVINEDAQVARLAEFSEAKPRAETLATVAHSFARGKVDIVLMPATAYQTFELYHGIGDKGGVLDIPIFYGMIQGIARQSAFPANFGQRMRRWMLKRFPISRNMIETAEKSIPEHYWIHTDKSNRDQLREFYKEIRLSLMAEHRFSPKALNVLWKIRCATRPELEECKISDRL